MSILQPPGVTKAALATTLGAYRKTPEFRRAPGPTDDSSLGHLTTAQWNYEGRIFTPLRLTPGKAVWQERQAGLTPGDACPGAIGLYGTIKMRAAYVGPAIRVKRASDGTELDIGFVGIHLDTETLDAFTANTTYTVPAYYDQTGNGNHWTQTSAANQPRMSSTATLDNRGKIRTIQHAGPLLDANVSPCWFDIPSTVVCDSQNMSVFVVGALPGCVQQTPILEMNPPSGSNYLLWNFGSSAWNYLLNTSGQTKASGLKTPANATIHGFTVQGSQGVTFYEGNHKAVSNTVATSVSYAGGKFGAYSSGAAVVVANASDFEHCAVAIYARNVSEADRANFFAAANRRCELSPQESDVIVYRGDSIHFGLRATKLVTPIRRLRDLLSVPAQYYNASRSGATIASMVPQFAVEVAPLLNPGARNVVLVSGAATNDIVNSVVTAASIFENVMLTFEAARAACPQVKCVGTTVIDRGAFTAAQRQVAIEYNTLIRANAGRVRLDAVIDYAADPDVGLSPTDGPDFYPNPTYNNDGTHPNDAGYGVMASLAAPVIRGLLT